MQRHLSTGANVIAALLMADRPAAADRTAMPPAPDRGALRLLAGLGREPRRPATRPSMERDAPAVG